jgi:hypothetical protein
MRILSVVLISLLLMSSIAFAGSSKTRQVTGIVTSIDVRNGLITVKKKGKAVLVKIKDRTKIRECVEKDSIKDINIGDKVTVRYKEAQEGNDATSVTIK